MQKMKTVFRIVGLKLFYTRTIKIAVQQLLLQKTARQFVYYLERNFTDLFGRENEIDNGSDENDTDGVPSKRKRHRKKNGNCQNQNLN